MNGVENYIKRLHAKKIGRMFSIAKNYNIYFNIKWTDRT